MRSTIAGAAALTLLAGCAAGPATRPRPAAPPLADTPAPTWRDYATAADRDRLAALPARFAAARAAIPARLASLASAEGALLDPAAAGPMPQLPPGSYRCRLVRLGGIARLRGFAPDFCYLDAAADGRLAFTKQTGTSLPQGYIYPDTDRQLVFLGSMRGVGEPAGRAYGADPASDVAGLVTRVAPFRWRLLLSRAGRGGDVDLYDLVPVPPEVRGATR